MMNRSYFQQEGGLDLLLKIYGILVSKEWGELGIDEKHHIYLERKCCLAVVNYGRSFLFKRQVVQLGGLEMYTTTLFRRQLQGDVGTLDAVVYTTLRFAAYGLSKSGYSHLNHCDQERMSCPEGQLICSQSLWAAHTLLL